MTDVLAAAETALAYGAPALGLVLALVLAGVDLVRRAPGATAWHVVPAAVCLSLLTVPVPAELPWETYTSDIEATWMFGARAQWVYGNGRLALATAAVLLLTVRILRDEEEPVLETATVPKTRVASGIAPVLGLALLATVDLWTVARLAPTVGAGLVAVWSLRGTRRKARGQAAVLGLCGLAQLAAVIQGWAPAFTSDVTPLDADAVLPVLVGAVLVGVPAWVRPSWAAWFAVLLAPFAFASWSEPAPAGLPQAGPGPVVLGRYPQNCARPWPDHSADERRRTSPVRIDSLGWPARDPSNRFSTSCALLVDGRLPIQDLPWHWPPQIVTTAGPMYASGGPTISAKVEVEVVPLPSGFRVSPPNGQPFEASLETLGPMIRERVSDPGYTIRVRPQGRDWTVQDAIDVCEAVQPAGCFWW
jgi:hypothetical protein